MAADPADALSGTWCSNTCLFPLLFVTSPLKAVSPATPDHKDILKAPNRPCVSLMIFTLRSIFFPVRCFLPPNYGPCLVFPFFQSSFHPPTSIGIHYGLSPFLESHGNLISTTPGKYFPLLPLLCSFVHLVAESFPPKPLTSSWYSCLFSCGLYFFFPPCHFLQVA